LAKKVNTGLEYNEEVINDRLSIYHTPSASGKNTFAEDIIYGLKANRKFILPKYFYDEKGSLLFEKICTTPEYYVTRTEASILKEYSDEIAECNADKRIIVELGSGSSIKTRYILNAFLRLNGNITYMPIDVSSIMIDSSKRLLNEFEGLGIKGTIGEYLDALEIIEETVSEPKLIIFLGSSIGNFDLPHAEEFMKKISDSMKTGDTLLVGFDLVKDINILNTAYNDKKGITAEFNLNLLHRINNELNSDIDTGKFEHKAFFNSDESRIEMHLVSNCDQSFSLNGSGPIIFKKNETIHTENSYKFTDEMVMKLIQKSGLTFVKKWTDAKDWFGLFLIRK
jgi:dimethylhistidine N-methyltransferase